MFTRKTNVYIDMSKLIIGIVLAFYAGMHLEGLIMAYRTSKLPSFELLFFIAFSIFTISCIVSGIADIQQ